MLLKENPGTHTAIVKRRCLHVSCCGRLSLVGVLLTEVLGSVDHVGEGTLDLVPLASLETAIGVDPELLRTDCFGSVQILWPN